MTNRSSDRTLCNWAWSPCVVSMHVVRAGPIFVLRAGEWVKMCDVYSKFYSGIACTGRRRRRMRTILLDFPKIALARFHSVLLLCCGHLHLASILYCCCVLGAHTLPPRALMTNTCLSSTSKSQAMTPLTEQGSLHSKIFHKVVTDCAASTAEQTSSCSSLPCLPPPHQFLFECSIHEVDAWGPLEHF